MPLNQWWTFKKKGEMKMTGKELQKELTWEFPHIGRKEPGQVEQAAGFCAGYKIIGGYSVF